MTTSVSLSVHQIAAFTAAHSDNHRYVQELNGRRVYFDTSAS